MDTVLEYIRWRGDIPLSCDGLRDADILVLSLLSYLDLKPVWSTHVEPFRLRDCKRMADAGKLRVLLTGTGLGYEQIMAAAINSRRFGELELRDYVDLVRQEPPTQFSALCFHAPNGLNFLTYRGTDDTLAGWEEDCMIGFTRTEAQKLALDYAKQHLKPGQRWYMAGHSKGGNLALFAACNLPDAALNTLERIYILDGPGLCPEVMDAKAVTRIEKRCRRISPSFSVIGKIFEPQISDARIVRSTVSGLLQHSLASWGIEYGELALCREHDPTSVWLNAAIRSWLANMSQENRVIFVHELFAALSAGGARTVTELDKGGRAGYELILRKLLESSDVTRHTLTDLPLQAVSQAVNLLRRQNTQAPKGSEL